MRVAAAMEAGSEKVQIRTIILRSKLINSLTENFTSTARRPGWACTIFLGTVEVKVQRM
jgi:hypothetical protein